MCDQGENKGQRFVIKWEILRLKNILTSVNGNTKDFVIPEHVLTVARRPLEIATGYLIFQLVARLGYWKCLLTYVW